MWKRIKKMFRRSARIVTAIVHIEPTQSGRTNITLTGNTFNWDESYKAVEFCASSIHDLYQCDLMGSLEDSLKRNEPYRPIRLTIVLDIAPQVPGIG